MRYFARSKIAAHGGALSKAKDGSHREGDFHAVQDVAGSIFIRAVWFLLPRKNGCLRSRGVKLDKALEMLKVKDEMALVDDN